MDSGATSVRRASPSVFISYSRADLSSATSVARALRSEGVRTWMDLEDLRPGESWQQAIGTALASADAFAMLLSSKSVESSWTSVELQTATRLGVPIVPVLIEAMSIELLPPEIRDIHIIDLSRSPYSDLAATAAGLISAHIGWAPSTSRQMSGFGVMPGTDVWVVLESGSAPPAAEADSWIERATALRDETVNAFALDLPCRRSALEDVCDALATAPQTTLVVPPHIPQPEAAFMIGTFGRIVGPGRLTVIAHASNQPNLKPFADMAQAHLTSLT